MVRTVTSRAASVTLGHVTMKTVDVIVGALLGIKRQLVRKVHADISPFLFFLQCVSSRFNIFA